MDAKIPQTVINPDMTTSMTTNDKKQKSMLPFFKDAPAYNDIHMPADVSPDTEISNTIVRREISSEKLSIPEPTNGITNGTTNGTTNDTPMQNMMSTIDSTIQQMELTSIEQIENTVLLYVKLLDPADKYYLKYQYVYDNGEKYITYLKSPEYVQYKKARKTLESKYASNKRYAVEVNKKHVIVYKKDSEGNIDKANKLDELERPTYINLLDIFDKSHTHITQMRLKLKSMYNQFIAKPYINIIVKNKFIKQRESMITKLNDFYSIQYFYNKVNGIIQTEKIVALPKLTYYYSENKQGLVPRLLTNDISIAAEDLQLLYDNGAAKLELYNKIQEEIIRALPDKKNELNDLIKTYINFDEEHHFLRELLHKIEKKKNYQIINYMVIPPGLEMPIDNSILKPRDMKPFFARYNANAKLNTT